MSGGPRVGLIGPGRWGRLILRDMVALGAEVHAVAQTLQSAEAASAAGAEEVVGSIEELAALDGYVVATPEQTHLEVVEALLPRGRPIFVEKPLDVDIPRAEALPAAAHRLVFVMHKWRYHPGIEALAQIAASRELGAVQGLMLERVGPTSPERKVSQIWVLAPHDLSIALHILGETPRLVWAAPHPVGRPGAGVMALLETLAGVRVSLNIAVGVPAPRRNMVLACAEGAAQLDDPMADHVKILKPGGELELRPISTELPLLRELRVFLEHLGGGPAPMTRLAEELVILRTVDALARAAEG